MTLVLQCLSALTAFLSAESNATKLPGWQPAVICRIANTQLHDTPIMDLCVLLNKWHNDCRDGRNWPHFYSSRAVQGSAAGQGRCNCATINKRWIHIDDELMERNETLLECMHLKGLTPLNSCQYLLNKTQRGHRPGSWVIAQSFRSSVMAFGSLTSNSSFKDNQRGTVW